MVLMDKCENAIEEERVCSRSFGFLLEGGRLFSTEKREMREECHFVLFPLMCVVFMRVERRDFVVSNELLLGEILVMMVTAK